VAILLGAAVLAIALSARPLTRQGAFAREHLLGIRLFADRTSLAGRGTLGDPLLPYAVMFARPRRAAGIVRRAMDDAGVARDVAADPTFLGTGRLLIRGAAVIAVAGALVIANLVPSPTVRPEYDAVFEGDVPGSYGMFVREFAADARLGVGAGGTPVLEVDERLQVTVADGGRDVRQVTRQWTDRPEGQDTALTVTGVTIDGEPAPYETGRLQGKALLRTTLADDWPGEHEVVISYRLDRPVGTTSSGAGWHDELRWTAIDPHWTSGWEGLGDDDEMIEVERVDVSLTVAEELAGRATSAGALDQAGRDPVAVRAPDAIERRDGQVTYRLNPEPQDDASPLGMRLLFDEGTLADGGRTAWLAWAAWQAAPIALNLALGALGLVLGVIGILRGRALGRGALRDAVLWAGPAAAAAQLPLFVWATADWSGEEPWFAVMGVLLLAALAASVWSVVVARRPDSRAPGGRGSRARRAP
jgi:hypothetical protein